MGGARRNPSFSAPDDGFRCALPILRGQAVISSTAVAAPCFSQRQILYTIPITCSTSQALAALITANPLLIQKTLADKLSDKISVVIAPPNVGGFFASGLLGGATPTAKPQPVSAPVANGVAPAETEWNGDEQ